MKRIKSCLFLGIALVASLEAAPNKLAKSESAFSEARRGYELSDEAISSSLMTFGAGPQMEENAAGDDFEPSYDPYLDRVPLKSFPSKGYEELLGNLGEAYAGGQDPYASEYTKKDPLVRFVELKYRDDRYWVIDNFRVSHLVGRKGEKDTSGGEIKSHQVDIRWTSALVDLEKLKGVTWVMTTFNTKVGPLKMQTGHAQLYFEFEDGGVVTPYGEVNSIVNSYEGYRDAGTIFNPVFGMMDKYDSIFVMGSFSDVTLKALKVFNGVDLYQLRLSPEEARRILVNSLALATDREELARRKYHTTRNSCVTNQVRLINSAIPEERRIQEWHAIFGKRVFRTLGSIFPSQIPTTLRKTGLMTSEVHYTGRDRILELYDRAVAKKAFMGDVKRRYIFSELYAEE